MRKKRYIHKYVVPPIVATTIMISPVLAGGVSASTFYVAGDTGSGVSTLQADLQDAGFHTAVDGSFGPDTRQTVIDFQKANDLQVDGSAGPETLGALDSNAGNSSSVTYYAYGDKGSGVRQVQSDLQKHGFHTAVDGSFGPDTRQTVIDFQRAKGLQVDGSAGPETLGALDKSSSGNKHNGSSGSSNGNVASTAQSYVGSPYIFGGTTPSGFDSSGFINYVFQQEGVNLSRTHAAMWADNGVRVQNPKPGDVVFFQGTYKSGISHSGVYIGNGKMVHAGTPETGVEVQNMNVGYWQDRYIGAKAMR